MPRLTESLPRYRNHKASGQAVVTLNGRDHYLGPHGSKVSRTQYDRLVGEWLANGRRSTIASDGGITVVELLARYWQHAKAHYVKNGEPTGEQAAIRAAAKPLKELYGKQPAAEFGPLSLEAVRRKMIDSGWSRGNINRSVNRVRRIFRWGVSKQLIPAEVVHALTTVDGLRKGRGEVRETAPIMPVETNDVDAAVAHLPPIVADMVALQRLTGMRPAEVCILRPLDLDRTGDIWSYRPESHKTEHHDRDRIVFVGPRGQEILLKYLARAAEAFCFQPQDSEAKRQAARHAARVTPTNAGNKPGSNRVRRPRRKPGAEYTVDSYRRAIHRACDKAGIPRWSPNRLRHAAATEVRSRFGLEAAQIVLGHSQAAVTQIYAARDHEKGREVARAIG